MEQDRVVVSPEDLHTWFVVQLRRLPDGVWRRNEEEERLKAEKRHLPGQFPDPKVELATEMVRWFRKAGWEVSHKRPTAPIDAELTWRRQQQQEEGR